MKAVGKCSKCKRVITTTCKGCIQSGTSKHMCKKGVDIVEIKWKVYPENETELMEIENEQ